jgi:hypothetical protein
MCVKRYGKYLLVLTSLVGAFSITIQAKTTSQGTFEVTRLNAGKAIITESMFQDLGASEYEGTSINGPSAIRIPDWIERKDRVNPSANYYLYFAHHSDKYIRMAWSANIEGPWHLYQVGRDIKKGNRGVLDLGESNMPIGNGIVIAHNHIASPNVHVDDDNKRIVMYFHAGSKTMVNGKAIKGQKTFVTKSPFGLEFAGKVEPVIIGNSYFSVFNYKDKIYALDNGANSYRARDSKNPWQVPEGWDFKEELWKKSENNGYSEDIKKAGYSSKKLRVRHTSTLVKGDTLYTFYSRRGTTPPERIMMSTTDLSAAKSYNDWNPSYPPEEIYHPQPGWEGGDLPLKPSKSGRAKENLNEIRDPAIFEDSDGQLYVFYAGKGEDALGVIKLTPKIDLANPNAKK